MMDMPDARLAPDAVERALALIDVRDVHEDLKPQRGLILGGVSLPSRVARAGLHPRRWLAPGLWAAHLKVPRSDGWRAFVLHAPSGTVIPTHAHGRDELIYVLQGGFHDGESFVAGDFAQSVAGSAHRLTVEDRGPCACLISIRGRVHWQGWSRVLGPALGI